MASNTIFKVYINKSTVGLNEYLINKNEVNSSKIYPNPARKHISIDYNIPNDTTIEIVIIDSNGKTVMNVSNEQLEKGNYTSTIDISNLVKGSYIIRVNNGKYYKFIKK